MTPDGITLHLIVKELNNLLINGRVNRIYQPEPNEIIINVYKHGHSFRLLISAHAENTRIHLTSMEKKNPLSPPLFCLILRKYLEGSRLIRIDQTNLDRVIHFTFSRLGESGEYKDITLIVEVMGKHSNIILIDPVEGLIIDGIKRYSYNISRYREVLPGRQYVAPPAQNKEHPLKMDEEKFINTLYAAPINISLEKILIQRIAGIGPVLAREILHRANIDPKICLEYCGDYDLRIVWQTFKNIIFPLLQCEITPTIVLDGKRPVCYAPIDLLQYKGLPFIRSETINQLLDIYYTKREEITKFEQLKTHLLNSVNREITRCEKKIHLYNQTRTEAGNAEKYKLRGEMLFAQLHLIKGKKTKVVLPNLYNPDEPLLEIELEPSLTPAQNAQLFFKKYEKARNALKKIETQISNISEELKYLTTVKIALEQAENLEEINEIKTELEDTGYLVAKRKKSIDKDHKKKKHYNILRVISPDGFEIFVGKNNKQNDYLTMRKAKDNDIWLHIKDGAGSHVIIKSQPGHMIPSSTLEMAAQLAAFFSEARHSSKVAVDYTERKNVTKPTKARPGFVLYENQKTIYITPKPPESFIEA